MNVVNKTTNTEIYEEDKHSNVAPKDGGMKQGKKGISLNPEQ